MDLFGGNGAYILHEQDARATARQLEYRRVARERAEQLDTAQENTETRILAHYRGARGLLFTLVRRHRGTGK